MRNIRKFLSVTASVAMMASLPACSYLPDWWGSNDIADPETRAKRISVLRTETELVRSVAADKVEVLLPKQFRNTSWSQANDQQMEANQHLFLPETVKEKESVDIGDGADEFHLTITPVMADGRLYAVDGEGYVSAYSLDKLKKRLWKAKSLFGDRKEEGVVGGGIAYANGKVFITTGFEEVVALDAATGKELWRKKVNSVVRAAPTVTNDTVLVLTVDSNFYALNSENGNVIWKHSGFADGLGTLGAPSPVFTKGLVIAPYSSGEVYALRETNGLERWYDNISGNTGETSFSLPDIDATPVVAYGKVFIGSASGLLVASDIATGKRFWEQEISIAKTPWVAGNMLFAITANAELAAIYIADGSIKWVVQLPQFIGNNSRKGSITWSGPVLAGGLLRVAGSDGDMLSVSPKDGSIVHLTNIPDEVYTRPVVSDGTLYLVSNDAELVQLR